MALIRDLLKTNGALHIGEVPLSTTGVFTFKVSAGKRINIVVGNAGGSTFDIVYYLQSEEDETESGQTRTLATSEADLTDATVERSSIMGMREVGINVTSATATAIQVEVLESKI